MMEDECHIFANLVENKMRSYSTLTRSAVQLAIMNILFSADRGHYEKDLPESLSAVPCSSSFSKISFGSSGVDNQNETICNDIKGKSKKYSLFVSF